MTIKGQYSWINKENQAPNMIKEFMNIYGVEEFESDKDNPIILEWADEMKVKEYYNHDSIAWCGLAMAIIAKRAGKEVPKGFLWALNWLRFGNEIETPMLGDILVFSRMGGGHVGLYIAEDKNFYHVGGGNQKDMVTIVRVDKKRLVGARRPIWKISQPLSVRRIILDEVGEISKNEA